MQDSFFCDSNILLYAFSNQDIVKQRISSKLLLDKRCILSVQVINEVSNILLKKLNFSNQKIIEFINSCYNRYEIITLDKEIFLLASDIRDRYNISYYDSLIVASALKSSTILYTEDIQHNLKIDSLTIINPFKEF